MNLPDSWRGKQGRCPQCNEVLDISESTQPKPKKKTTSRKAARPQPVEPVDEPRDQDLEHLQRASPRQRGQLPLLLITTGCALIFGGLLFVFWPPGDDGKPSDEISANKGEVFRPDTSTIPDNLRTPPPVPDPIAPSTKSTKPTIEPKTQAVPNKSATITVRSIDSWNIADFGIMLDRTSSYLEIDGVEKMVDDLSGLTRSKPLAIILPRGKHFIRTSPKGLGTIIEPRNWFVEYYVESTERFRVNGNLNFDQLLDYSRKSLDQFNNPMIPHLWGVYYLERQQYQAAVRHFNWALEIMPSFAPSHYNRASALARLGQTEQARENLRRADFWNIQNAYGMAESASALHNELGVVGFESVSAISWKVRPLDELTDLDQRMIDFMTTSAQFATEAVERAKIVNNLGAYFESESKYELSVTYYRSALAMAGNQSPDNDSSSVVVGILANLARVCRTAELVEAERYEAIQKSLITNAQPVGNL